MSRLYFGPVRPLPSWYWVGQDVAEQLRCAHDVRYFSRVDDIANDAIVFWVKAPPDRQSCARLVDKRARIIYLPVDQYASEADIAAHAAFHAICRLVVVHLHTMRAFFSGVPVMTVDHYNKYGIDCASRSPTSGPLWVGGYQYLPYIVLHMAREGIDIPIDVLTDYRTPSAVAAACRLGQQLQLEMDFAMPLRLPGMAIHEWTEARQADMLRACSAAFDYKHVDDFNQRFKPPTKLQKYTASGIPAAINRDSPLHAHMLADGVDLCSFADTATWSSAAYARMISTYAAQVAPRLRIEAIAARYQVFAAAV
jgi:hypothetical protein